MKKKKCPKHCQKIFITLKASFKRNLNYVNSRATLDCSEEKLREQPTYNHDTLEHKQDELQGHTPFGTCLFIVCQKVLSKIHFSPIVLACKKNKRSSEGRPRRFSLLRQYYVIPKYLVERSDCCLFRSN